MKLGERLVWTVPGSLTAVGLILILGNWLPWRVPLWVAFLPLAVYAIVLAGGIIIMVRNYERDDDDRDE